MTKVEEVARAIDPEVWACDGPIPTRGDTIAFHERRQVSVAQARAAIEAMRKATPEMAMAGAPKITAQMPRKGVQADYCAAHDAWTAMIDAALQEGA